MRVSIAESQMNYYYYYYYCHGGDRHVSFPYLFIFSEKIDAREMAPVKRPENCSHENQFSESWKFKVDADDEDFV